ncbi:hypothetical protein AXF42_Ash002272 [Apostasia shenzhenica]|uniref:Sec-independent protein translocase protein TatB n=1 Tax=Apostasia shenzhenica TaxID=1088818 RepID=A0A2I0AN18_9ASPA|nr:hypothetical protein AXF42_Ash002272 [Apostasia shenzhenica]
MFGISYGELFLIIGATAALIGPKDLPVVARAAGRLAGRAIGYVQMARGQFESVMQQSNVGEVHKELQDAMAQLEAIRYEIRSISVMNPITFSRRLDVKEPPANEGASVKSEGNHTPVLNTSNVACHHVSSPLRDLNSSDTIPSSLYSQAMVYARLAETPTIKSGSYKTDGNVEILNGGDDLPSVLPVSAEAAGLFPKRSGDVKGSDIVLEAIVEAEVAHSAKQFFSLPENQLLPKEQ